MSFLPALCQRLLMGPLAPGDLPRVEALIERSLKGVSSRCDLPPVGQDWQAGFGDLFFSPGRNAPAILSCAPLLQLEGVWLSRMGQPAVAHLPAQNALFRIHGDLAGLDDPVTSSSMRHHAELMSHGVGLPERGSPDYFTARSLSPSGLDFAVLSLGLSHRSRRYCPEILGFTLAWLCEDRPGGFPKGLAAQRARHLGIVRALVEARGGCPQRIQAGWNLYVVAVMAMAHEASGWCPGETDAHAAMRDLIQSRLPDAVGYHSRVMLQGRNLDQWLQAFSSDPDALLDDLRQSGLVDRRCPAASRFLSAMAFGGPMFGVFSEKECGVIRQWMADPAATPVPSMPRADEPTLGSESLNCPVTRAVPTSTRALYHELLRVESPGDGIDHARHHVRGILRLTRWLQPFFHLKPPGFDYSPEALHDFVQGVHRAALGRHAARGKPRRINKGFLRWFLTQLAPAILVDGAWLAELPPSGDRLEPHVRYLMKILLDEVGDGHVEWNHPNVYRLLLDSLGLDLPDFDQRAFADSCCFMDAAFDIPAYLLSMGLVAREHVPELLGLNLAIELSGLGADYLEAIAILREHELDPTIVQLHLGIDNTACGHAALAVRAIQAYLSRIGDLEGSAAVQAVWRRIWLGHESLRVVGLRFAAAVIWRYWLDHGLRRKRVIR